MQPETSSPLISQSNGNPPEYSEKSNFLLNSISNIPNPQITQDPQLVMIPQTNEDHSIEKFHHSKRHLIFGRITIVLGIFIVVVDPLIPILYKYGFSIFCAGVFMIISGICTILALRRNRKILLISAMIFSIFSLINIVLGIIYAILAVTVSILNKRPCIKYESDEKDENYNSCLQRNEMFRMFFIFGIISIILTGSLLILLIVDSSMKCRAVCCRHRKQSPVYVLSHI